MYLEFLDATHQERFAKLIEEAKTSPGDLDRIAMFYIIAGNSDLFSKARALYNFSKNEIYAEDWNERADFSGGARRLVTLAFNLFNGYTCNPYDTFDGLDYRNRELAHRAIRVRFSY